jgi:two-component system, NarL family, sensor histidine kinase BarA
MSGEAPPAAMDLAALTLGHGLKLQDLVDREALGELARSFFRLHGVGIRVFSIDGLLLADASEEQAICRYLNTLPNGRAACARTIAAVKRLTPEGSSMLHPCFTGAVYHIVNVEYDRRRLGRIILGPYLPDNTEDAPRSLLEIDPTLDHKRTRELLPMMPRLRAERADQLSEHLRATLDLILFSGHKALLTSQMHLATVRDSYRELQEKNARLQEAVDRLRELDRLKSNFLATVSHELRTPLTSIIGYSEMLAEGIAGELEGEQKEFVQTIREKGEQLLQLIMNLLDLSKLESGTMSVKRQIAPIGAVLKQVVSTLLPTARKKGVVLEAVDDPSLPELVADPERLRQVFINLTENALKFTPPEGSVTLSARAVAAPGDDDGGFVLMAANEAAIEVRVADTGIGIPESERGRVFDPFYQVDSSSTREYGGTGLGLSIVKRLVEAHNGTIRIESNHPKGTAIIVTLPLP